MKPKLFRKAWQRSPLCNVLINKWEIVRTLECLSTLLRCDHSWGFIICQYKPTKSAVFWISGCLVMKSESKYLWLWIDIQFRTPRNLWWSTLCSAVHCVFLRIFTCSLVCSWSYSITFLLRKLLQSIFNHLLIWLFDICFESPLKHDFLKLYWLQINHNQCSANSRTQFSIHPLSSSWKLCRARYWQYN